MSLFDIVLAVISLLFVSASARSRSEFRRLQLDYYVLTLHISIIYSEWHTFTAIGRRYRSGREERSLQSPYKAKYMDNGRRAQASCPSLVSKGLDFTTVSVRCLHYYDIKRVCSRMFDTSLQLLLRLRSIYCTEEDTLGLSSGSSAPTTAIQVTPALLSRSRQLFVKNLQARSDWTKTVMGHREHEKEEVEDEDERQQAADPMVQKVKEATDLNKYERKLLNCIVNGGKFALVS